MKAKTKKKDILRANLNKPLCYDQQLVFKKAAKKALGLKGDPFYFDSTTGVDAKTDRDLPGLRCDGGITWGKAVIALQRHFAK